MHHNSSTFMSNPLLKMNKAQLQKLVQQHAPKLSYAMKQLKIATDEHEQLDRDKEGMLNALSKCNLTLDQMEDHQGVMLDAYERHLNTLEQVQAAFDAARKEYGDMQSIRQSTEIVEALQEETEEFIDLMERLFENEDSDESDSEAEDEGDIDYGAMLEKLEIKEEKDTSRDHLHRKKSHRKEFEVARKRDTLPIEIASIVYSRCTLESSVALRQVNSFWYNAYEASDTALQAQLMTRFPWMKPEGEMKTWGDCALVFVSRLKSKKWIAVRGMDDIPVPQYRGPAPHEVCPKEIGEEGLPANFKGLEGTGFETHRNDDCKPACCELIHLDHNNKPMLQDPVTLKKLPNFPQQIKVVSKTAKELVVRYRGIEITFPASVRPQDLPQYFSYSRLPPVMVNREFIQVDTEKGTYIFPRDKPHYKDAFVYPKDDNSGIWVNQAFFRDSRVVDRGLHKGLFHIFDPHGKKLVKYSTPCKPHPVALYKGLFWWNSQEKTTLTPTFIDLASPGKVYYRKDRIVKIGVSNVWTEYFQITQPGNEQFIMKQHPEGLYVMDLDTGLLTDVYMEEELIDEGPLGRIFCGFEGDKFEAYVLPHDEIIQRTLDAYGLKKEGQIKSDRLPTEDEQFGYMTRE